MITRFLGMIFNPREIDKKINCGSQAGKRI